MPIFLKTCLILISIIIFITASLSLISGLLLRRSFLQTTRANMEVTTEMAHDILEKKIVLLKANATIVAQQTVLASPDNLAKAFQQAHEQFPDFLAFAIFEGQDKIFDWGELAAPGLRPDSPYLQNALKGQETISTTRKYLDTGQLVIYVSVPLGSRVLTITIDGLTFQNLLADFRPWRTGAFFLLDEQGTVLASAIREDVVNQNSIHATNHDSPRLAALGVAIAGAIQDMEQNQGEMIYGRERIFSWRRLASGWVVGMALPIEDSPAAKAKEILFWVTFAYIIGGIIIAFLLSNVMSKPFLLINAQNKRLERLNEEVISANEAKSRFIANTSHEIRTPLNAIVGLTELMLNEGDICPPGHVENLEKVSRASTSLLSIVNDILDFSKINSDQFEIHSVNYHLPSIINDVVTQSMVYAANKPIALKLHVDPDIPNRLRGDDIRIKQILNNLMSNAFKYTRAGTVSLDIATERGEGEDVWLSLTVTDTGIGIRPEDREKIFSIYYQPDAKANRRIEGTGLGLPLTKQLVTLMDGSISVESEHGHGSVFKVRLRQKRAGDTSIGRDVAQNLARYSYTSRSATQRRLDRMPLPLQLPNARVLVVDDVPTNLDVAKGLLKHYGMKVDCVTSGTTAIELVKAERVRYNAIFMDHMMPGMDGIEAVQVIRNEIGTEYAKTVPIIALSANAMADMETVFLQSGFQAFVSKPIDSLWLDMVIRQWIRNKEPEAETGSATIPGAHVQRRPEEGAPAPTNAPQGNDGKSERRDRRGMGRRRYPDRRKRSGTTRIFPPSWAEGEVDGLNIERGLSRFNNDMEAYLRVAESFVRHTPVPLEHLRDVLPETLYDYTITVHGLKTSFRNIGAESLGDQAEALEKAGKAGDFAFVSTHTPAFIKEAQTLFAALTAKLKASPYRKPARDEPDPAVLDEVRAACETFDIDRLGEAMKTLASHEYTSPVGAKLAAWLEEKTYQLDFVGIAGRLAEITSGTNPNRYL
ncbi:MAG: ATP-binding protein [Syntrophaceae bacterium]|nr:ATP-binding protein [Syntrophaceae bacterium]